MTHPPTDQPQTAPETKVSGAVPVSEVARFVDALQRVLYTEPGWEKPITQERLGDLLTLTMRDLERKAS